MSNSPSAGFSLAMWIAIILTPLQIVLGDLHGRNTLAYQPIKVAAMEGDWETQRGQPLVLFAWPDMAAQRNVYEVAIPKLGSLILTHSWNGVVDRASKRFRRTTSRRCRLSFSPSA